MKFKDNDGKQAFVTKIIYRFFGGAALGTFVVAIFILNELFFNNESFNNLNLVRVSILIMLIISSGLLSIVWGEKFIDAVMRVLDNTNL
jgi:hypothetical protein